MVNRNPFTPHQVTKEQCWATTDGMHYHPLLVQRVALLLAAIGDCAARTGTGRRIVFSEQYKLTTLRLMVVGWLT
jgi:hypothetical protein